MKGSLTKIQKLLRNHQPENKELGMQLLEAYCHSLNYAPTLLHLLQKGKQYVTYEKRIRIENRILNETSKRMFNILLTHILGDLLIEIRGHDPLCSRSSYYYTMWDPDKYGKTRVWKRNSIGYSIKYPLRSYRKWLHAYITQLDYSFEKAMGFRERYIGVVLKDIISRRTRALVEKALSTKIKKKHEKFEEIA